jgi:hypothetical protein
MVISTLLFLHKSMAPQLLKKLKTCNSYHMTYYYSKYFSNFHKSGYRLLVET